jgi:hypothetical protein
MGAVQNNYAIVMVAAGGLLNPVAPGNPFWNGHSSPANVVAAYIGDPVVNSIIFPKPTGP